MAFAGFSLADQIGLALRNALRSRLLGEPILTQGAIEPPPGARHAVDLSPTVEPGRRNLFHFPCKQRLLKRSGFQVCFRFLPVTDGGCSFGCQDFSGPPLGLVGLGRGRPR